VSLPLSMRPWSRSLLTITSPIGASPFQSCLINVSSATIQTAATSIPLRNVRFLRSLACGLRSVQLRIRAPTQRCAWLPIPHPILHPPCLWLLLLCPVADHHLLQMPARPTLRQSPTILVRSLTMKGSMKAHSMWGPLNLAQTVLLICLLPHLVLTLLPSFPLPIPHLRLWFLPTQVPLVWLVTLKELLLFIFQETSWLSSKTPSRILSRALLMTDVPAWAFWLLILAPPTT
jgi:hypothetical protein